MRIIEADTAPAYLRECGFLPADAEAVAVPLAGGVSNLALVIATHNGARFVLKQSRERLRTKAAWYGRLDRILIERDALLHLASVLPPGSVPSVLLSDPSNYILAMSHAPEGSVVWKERLLAGDTGLEPARAAGAALGMMHSSPLPQPEIAARLGDLQVFDQLRIDPYYRTIMRMYVDIHDRLQDLISSLESAHPPRFVHADFSPKNILVHSGGLFIVDFETAHLGDPAFDVGFFGSHLVLKAFRAAPEHEPYLALLETFLASYRAATAGLGAEAEAVLSRALVHLPACTLARIDGKSPVEYLSPAQQARVRDFAVDALYENPQTWAEAFDRLHDALV